MKSLVSVLLLVAMQGRTLYEDTAQSIGVYNYTSAEGGTDESGNFEFKAEGNPLRVESRLQGLTILSPRMEGVIGRGPDPKDPKRTASFVKSLNSAGQSVVTFDSEVQYKAQAEHAAKFKLEPPAPLKSSESGKLETAELVYSGFLTEGTFQIPKPFTLTMQAMGKRTVEVKGPEGTPAQKVEKLFKNSASATGVSATIHMDPLARGAKQLKDGLIKGRLRLHMEQSETTANVPAPEITVLDGEADEMRFDLKTSRTVTLSGNVKITGNTNALHGTTEADVAVITLDANLQPIRIRFTGQPIKSTLREKKPGGGGKK